MFTGIPRHRHMDHSPRPAHPTIIDIAEEVADAGFCGKEVPCDEADLKPLRRPSGVDCFGTCTNTATVRFESGFSLLRCADQVRLWSDILGKEPG